MNQLSTCKTLPNPERLPPTENAAMYHVLRVHFQVVQWRFLTEGQLNPEEWGWKNENGVLVPIDTDLKAAPDDVLNIISCKCKMVRKSPCGSQLCSCRKHGLSCVPACKHCCGKVCCNAVIDAQDYTHQRNYIEDDEQQFRIMINDFELAEGVELYEEVVDVQ